MTDGIILNNKILDVVFVAWFLAQAYKVVTSLVKEKKINFRRFIGTGGMPSSHSSTTMALVSSVAIVEGGFSSPIFAACFIFAGVVMYDAAGVRRAAGKQASVLNKIVTNISNKEGHKIVEENLKELLGHTPFEVLVGAILGIVVSLLMSGYLT